MARPTKDKQRVPVSGSVLPEIATELEAIAIKEDRTKSQIIEKLLLRGLAAYNQDGYLSEATGNSGVKVEIEKQVPQQVPLSSNFLMSDPKGRNAGTKRLPKAIQRDIDYAKAEVEEAKRKQRS